MYSCHPELWLCCQHWKANIIASSVYPEWCQTYTRNLEDQMVKKEDAGDSRCSKKACKHTLSPLPASPRKSTKSQSGECCPSYLYWALIQRVHIQLIPLSVTKSHVQQMKASVYVSFLSVHPFCPLNGFGGHPNHESQSPIIIQA